MQPSFTPLHSWNISVWFKLQSLITAVYWICFTPLHRESGLHFPFPVQAGPLPAWIVLVGAWPTTVCLSECEVFWWMKASLCGVGNGQRRQRFRDSCRSPFVLFPPFYYMWKLECCSYRSDIKTHQLCLKIIWSSLAYQILSTIASITFTIAYSRIAVHIHNQYLGCFLLHRFRTKHVSIIYQWLQMDIENADGMLI